MDLLKKFYGISKVCLHWISKKNVHLRLYLIIINIQQKCCTWCTYVYNVVHDVCIMDIIRVVLKRAVKYYIKQKKYNKLG